MKIGLDIHGVLDSNVHGHLFANMSVSLIKDGHEVHIITGEHWTPDTERKLESWGVQYTHHFSIADYHKEIGTPMSYKDPQNPFLDSYLWDRTKADYCKRKNIDMHFDDSPTYGNYFKDKSVYIKV